MTFELAADEPWVNRAFGQARRYAEVTSCDEMIAYLESVREPAAARR